MDVRGKTCGGWRSGCSCRRKIGQEPSYDSCSDSSRCSIVSARSYAAAATACNYVLPSRHDHCPCGVGVHLRTLRMGVGLIRKRCGVSGGSLRPPRVHWVSQPVRMIFSTDIGAD